MVLVKVHGEVGGEFLPFFVGGLGGDLRELFPNGWGCCEGLGCGCGFGHEDDDANALGGWGGLKGLIEY